ncbi:SapC family protein [Methylomicrobium agile]|uniref:SapC family protein n=1 Tax=Methylomicrobium agile TaxID=39774 RepID=UPI0004DED7F1|nr:SapC family protein [Methylomicrobium agile]
MNPNYQPLDAVPHRQHGRKKAQGYVFARNDAFAPLLIAELSHAIAHYPLAFRPIDSGPFQGHFQLVVLLGMCAGENLFVDAHGQWRAPYIPGHFRAYPFRLLQVRSSEDKQLIMLGFDHASGLYREAPDPLQQEERFFDDQGQPQPWLQEVSNFLVESAKNQRLTQQAVEALAAAKVLVPWELPKAGLDDERPLLSDLCCIDAAAMKTLPGSVLEILRDTQALDLAYAQLFSMQRLVSLQALYRQREQQKAKAHAEGRRERQLPIGDLGLGALFGTSAPSDSMDLEWLKNYK